MTTGSAEMRENIMKCFTKMPKEMTGAFWESDTLYVVSAEIIDGELWVKYTASEKLTDWLAGGNVPTPAERLKLCCTKSGMALDSLAIAISQAVVFSYEKVFPLPLPEGNKCDDMLRLDILVNGPYENDNCWWSAMPVDGEGKFYLTAIGEDVGVGLLRELSKTAIKPVSIVAEKADYQFLYDEQCLDYAGKQIRLKDNVRNTVWDHGMQTALWAALSGIYFDKANMLPKAERPGRFSWKYLELCLIGGAILFGACLFLGNSWQLHKIEQQLAEQHERFELVADERRKMKLNEQAEQKIKKADRLMIKISQNRRSFYNLFLRLGLATDGDPYINELKIDNEGNIVVYGQGSSYEKINIFLEALRETKEIFQENMHLEKSEINKQGEIVFMVKGKVK